ncbi:phage minor capsid protein [Brachybacterium kimchii]|uniref:Phage minor capsid protein n=1 Tax=Brachybacterium kimchii TaxID=2942909 RepID=A0ABY4N4I1_9MICO|nr:phage minor capsid protein [Brachybacterium kimchii]UQN29474.1 phage minor capsid protein [Brachybacterium kimchii]
MPASPDMAREVAQRVRLIYEAAEDHAVRVITRRLADGLDAPDWAQQKAAELPGVLQELDRYMRRLDEAAPALFERVIAEAYQQGLTAAHLDVKGLGIVPEPLGGINASQAVQALVESLVATQAGAAPRVVRAVSDMYQDVTAETAAQVLTGTASRREAARSALGKYADRGVRAFRDRSGRRWDLASYAEMATRTTAGQAAIAGHTDQLKDLGQDLVKVSTSPESCPECSPWQGRVLSLTGRTSGRLSDGVRVAGTIDRARAAGFQHPNCTHTVGLYLPGHSSRAKAAPADPKVYETRQRQRSYERQVRGWKRRADMDAAFYGPDSPEAKRTRTKLRARQSQFKAWREENGRKSLSYRTSLTAR